jgi:hypothetical protein
MRSIVAWVLGGALALTGCGSDGGSSGGGGSNGGNAAPEIMDVAWAEAQGCMTGVRSDVEITVTASDSDGNDAELTYSGSVTSCTGTINASVSTVSCPNAAPYQGTVTVSDPGGRSSSATFPVPVCASGSCTDTPIVCSL